MVKPDFFGFAVIVDTLPEETSNIEDACCLEDVDEELGDTAEGSDNSLTSGAEGGGKTGGIKVGNVGFAFIP